MGDKNIATVRFSVEGVEAQLYQKILEGKEKAGLSVPDYIKRILSEHFSEKDRQKNLEELSERFRMELITDMQQIIRECVRGNGIMSENSLLVDTAMADGDRLPAQSEEIPEGALDFLDDIC